nr:hypothetical protein [Desulfobulbaceae bacterium]
MSPRYIISDNSTLSMDPQQFPLLGGLKGEMAEVAGVFWPRTVAFSDGTIEPIFIGGVLCSSEISRIAQTIALELVERYSRKKILLIQLLEGAIPFCEMVCENLSSFKPENMGYEVASLKVSSYIDGSQAQKHQLSQPLHCNGREVLTLANYDQVVILDDLIDAGNTVTWLVKEYLPSFSPKKLSAYFMLEKNRGRAVEANIILDRLEAVCGKQVPNDWVVGYGLDMRLPGEKGQHALHLFRGRLPGGIYAFNAAIETKLIADYQKNPQQLLRQLQLYVSNV